MKQPHQFTGIIEREGDGYVALCPELDIASQGNTVEEARSNLIEAIELFFLKRRLLPRSNSASEAKSLSRVWRLPLGRLRVLSGREVCNILAAQGFRQVRQRGSHMIMQKQVESSTITVPVPNHDEIRIGTLQSLIRQSGLPRALFEV